MANNASGNDRSKLPKWARMEMEKLEADLRATKRDLAGSSVVFERFGDKPDSVAVSRSCGSMEYASMPRDTRVQFWFTRYNRPVMIEVYQDSVGDVLVRTESDQMSVEPRSSNVVAVKFAPR